MDHRQIAECAVESGRKARVAERHTLAQHIRVAHTDDEFQVLCAVGCEVDQSICIEAQSAPDQGRPAIESAVVDRQIGLQRDIIAQRARGDAGEKIGRIELAQQAEAARLVGYAHGRHALFVAAHQQSAGPLRPGSIAAQPRGIGMVEARQCCQRAIGGRSKIEGEIEIVAIGLGVEQ